VEGGEWRVEGGPSPESSPDCAYCGSVEAPLPRPPVSRHGDPHTGLPAPGAGRGIQRFFEPRDLLGSEEVTSRGIPGHKITSSWEEWDGAPVDCQQVPGSHGHICNRPATFSREYPG
jgi:hypothetical protein